jgi:hypothetical protein
MIVLGIVLNLVGYPSGTPAVAAPLATAGDVATTADWLHRGTACRLATTTDLFSWTGP